MSASWNSYKYLHNIPSKYKHILPPKLSSSNHMLWKQANDSKELGKTLPHRSFWASINASKIAVACFKLQTIFDACAFQPNMALIVA